MLLKEVRHETKEGKKLLFKVLIEEDALVISATCRGEDSPVLVDLTRIMEPYMKPAAMRVMKKVCNVVYLRRQQEIAKQAS